MVIYTQWNIFRYIFMSSKERIAFNARAHDAIIHAYDVRHGEIFNDREQKRLRTALERAVAILGKDPALCSALDVGSGSGNLTRHLRDLGFRVTAADVSARALRLVAERFGGVKTVQLHDDGLLPMANGSFEVVAAYSVLHHVPDYLALVREMLRVLVPGGVLFLDHEHAGGYWDDDRIYGEFSKKMHDRMPFVWQKLFDPRRYYSRIRKFFQPRFQIEGDIHVFPDDHIVWDNIIQVINDAGATVVVSEDYLAYQAGYDVEMYEAYAHKCADMHVLIARK